MRIPTALIAASFVGVAFATLPPQTDEARAAAKEAAAKAAWSDKIAQYQLCLAQDRTAEAYRKSLAAGGKDLPAGAATAPCTDPGPYVSEVTPPQSKPLEAAGAHSPPGVATSPPSGKATASEISNVVKK